MLVAVARLWCYSSCMPLLIESISAYLEGRDQCICITGSGGKTTLMIQLARYYGHIGKKVLLSTTTKVQLPEHRDYHCDYYFEDSESILIHESRSSERVFFALRGNQKALAPPNELLEQLQKQYDVVLLEADGAGQKGLKLHTERDPVVPEYTSATIAVLSFSLLGRSLHSECFGCESLNDQRIDLNTYALLLEHEQGVQKRMKGKSLILCNQAELARKEDMDALSKRCPSLPLWFGSIEKNILIQRNMQ